MANLPSVILGASRTVRAVGIGASHTCAVLDDGHVRCWGVNPHGELGQNNTTNAGDGQGASTAMASLPDIDFGVAAKAIGLAVGSTHSCALLETGGIRCWGANTHGQLGRNDVSSVGNGGANGPMSLQADVDLGGGHKAKAIAAGDQHTCAILDDDTLKCWGANQYGQLGQNDTTVRGDSAGTTVAATPVVNLGAEKRVRAVAAGASHTCVIRWDDKLLCFGRNNYGQLGRDGIVPLGDSVSDSVTGADAVNLGKSIVGVATGADHTCAMSSDGALICFGHGASGQLGYDSPLNRGNGGAPLMGVMTGVALGRAVSQP
jgi:alpha-tubulin suppressor-like RCC1 family protein